MVTLIESPRVAFASGSNQQASSSFSLHRLILPFLCIAIGVSVGTATGLTLALVNASNSALAASNDVASTNSVQASPAPAASVAMNAGPAQVSQPAIAPQTVASQDTQAATPASSIAVESLVSKPNLAPSLSDASAARTIKTTPKVELALNKTPDAMKPATIKLEGKEYRVAKMMFVPAAQPEPNEPALPQPVAPMAMNTAQMSIDTATPASLYTEGVLTVADYNESAGTIQTSDGKTFVLGTTVAAGNAVSWEIYRSDLHYRCDQNGSCVLMRAGVVAPNARLI